ncbi:hypothetical protein B835_2527 [Enterococcus mundtii 3F]|nr:hypothetical protein [Enterococcus mundtii 3F]
MKLSLEMGQRTILICEESILRKNLKTSLNVIGYFTIVDARHMN